MKMEERWISILSEVDTVNDSGNPLHLVGVKALQHVETREIVFRPHDIAQAEIEALAKRHGLKEARDVSTFLILFANPSEGMIKGGDILYKYHLQKTLFYLWKGLDDAGLPDVMPRDEFMPAANGPMPVHLDEDLDRFIDQGLIDIRLKDWNPEYERLMKHILLLDDGLSLAKNIWIESPTDYSSMALWAKKLIYPMSPHQVRELVHSKYPEFIDETVNDIE